MLPLIARPLPLCARPAHTHLARVRALAIPAFPTGKPLVRPLVRPPVRPLVSPHRSLGDVIRREALWKRSYSTPAAPLHPTTAPPPKPPRPPRTRSSRWRRLAIYLAAFGAITWASYEFIPPARHLLVAFIRCFRLLRAVLLNVIDYRWMFAKQYDESIFTPEEIKEFRRGDRRECHKRSSRRLFEALKRNAGIYVKLGQHISSIQALPKEWTEAMRPLQDQCYPTPLPKLDEMLRKDMGLSMDELFSDFDPTPIGVASLAQVHRATDRRTGRGVAVKLQHPHLEEFVQIDIKTVRWSMWFVKSVFPDFEFSWLGDEMTHMLPLEMDFAHEAWNSDKVREDFAHLKGKTALYVPEVLWAERRCLVMEFIEGARVDDLKYLKEHQIDRNQVSQELSKIFSQMVYINGYFHADPHHGNLLIRPKPRGSTSPYKFEVVLLDHGQYFDIPDDLRVNYARFWLSLIAGNSPEVLAQRRKYARLVANISDDLYPILETAITGRAGLEDYESPDSKAKNLLSLKQMSNDELDTIRNAMVEREGLIASIFSLLRNAPRRLVMILKLNDLQRALDISLATTHGASRIFIIVARFCAFAVHEDDQRILRERRAKYGITTDWLVDYVREWYNFHWFYTGLRVVEWGMDARARAVKVLLWLKGLRERGWEGAFEVSAGLQP
ncbi:hypothetical protein NliqN6_3481 [Naganishia liquefaciens]|uniref:ABC1 atypical kinase-like domain-containing protein n=1 Tax=Naganishia liquefaciens TaxID=104408 RepID=A0A8H3TVR8_9TREE|nr:hypothetical protein NliqN6_3481 [Naganishia liquefaciens]